MKIEITSLRVVGCGPLQDVRIDFTDKETGKPLPVVLLAGANGSGKTTVLEVMFGLAQMLDPKITQVSPVLQRSLYAIMDCIVDGVPFTFHYGRLGDYEDRNLSLAPENVGNSYRIYGPTQQVLFDTLSSSDISAKRYSESIGINGTLLAQHIQMAMRDSDNALSERYGLNSDLNKEEHYDFAPSVLYFPYYRAIEPVESQEIRREPTDYKWTHKYEVVKSFDGSLSSYLIWLDYAEPEAFLSVKNFLDALYPDHKTFGINRRELKAVVHTANGGVHDVDKLSSGEQNLLVMLLELRRRLLPGSIVLIDELENSLHPAFQHRLAQGLLQLQREIPFQLIATTHAETFVDIFGTKATRVLPVPSAIPAAEVK